MEAFFEEYNMIFVMTAVGCISIGIKSIIAIVYADLIAQSCQMQCIQDKWLKNLVSKIDASYQLKMKIHDTKSLVDMCVYNMKYAGVSLETWKNEGIYGLAFMAVVYGADMLAGSYYRFDGQWFLGNTMSAVAIAVLMISSELFLQLHEKDKRLKLQLSDYIENILIPRLERQYIQSDKNKVYQLECTEPDTANITEDAAPASEVSFITKEDMELFKEILGEFMGE